MKMKTYETGNKNEQITGYAMYYIEAVCACKGMCLASRALLAGRTVDPQITARRSEMYRTALGCQCRLQECLSERRVRVYGQNQLVQRRL